MTYGRHILDSVKTNLRIKDYNVNHLRIFSCLYDTHSKVCGEHCGDC